MSNRRAVKRKSGVTREVAPDIVRVKGSWRPNFVVVAIFALIGAVVSLFLILILSEGPDTLIQAEKAASPGGETTVAKSYVRRPDDQNSVVVEPPPAVTENLKKPRKSIPVPTEPAPAPVAAQAKPTEVSPPLPVPAPVPSPTSGQRKASTPPSLALPWQSDKAANATSDQPRVASLPPDAESSSGAGERSVLPSRSDLKGWLKSEAREFVGGVDADGLPLYRFDVWLDAPEDIKSQMRMVSYEYLAPSAQPPVQSSNDPKDGFRVKFGAAACAEKATVIFVMKDGRERKVTVDGCRILN